MGVGIRDHGLDDRSGSIRIPRNTWRRHRGEGRFLSRPHFIDPLIGSIDQALENLPFVVHTFLIITRIRLLAISRDSIKVSSWEMQMEALALSRQSVKVKAIGRQGSRWTSMILP